VKYIFEKLDGSLISFFRVAEDIELKSMKSVESDVAINARKYFENRLDIYVFVEEMLDKGLSPMFEYVSPSNKIVLSYEEDFVFLGARSLLDGKIYYPKYDIPVPKGITHPEIFSSMEDARSFMKREDVEGVVLTFENGMMMKMKTDHYCRIHKLLDNFVPKNLVANIIEGSFDDVIGLFTDHGLTNEIKLAREIETRFWNKVNKVKSEAEEYFNANKNKERKEVARELIPERKELASLVFKLFDGQDLLPYIMKKLAKEAKEWRFESNT
jgi:RNA ligase